MRNVETLDTDGEIVTRGGEDAREGGGLGGRRRYIRDGGSTWSFPFRPGWEELPRLFHPSSILSPWLASHHRRITRHTPTPTPIARRRRRRGSFVQSSSQKLCQLAATTPLSSPSKPFPARAGRRSRPLIPRNVFVRTLRECEKWEATGDVGESVCTRKAHASRLREH